MPRDDRYSCKCHERMGNDFWFLPTGQCLYGQCDSPPKRPCVGELIEMATGPLGDVERDPIRGGVLQ